MDWKKVFEDMLAAAKGAAAQDWPALRDYARHEFETLSSIAARLEVRKLDGSITEVNARFLIGQYALAAKSVLYAVEGLKNVMIERAWNAAMAVLNLAINKAIGWALL